MWIFHEIKISYSENDNIHYHNVDFNSNGMKSNFTHIHADVIANFCFEKYLCILVRAKDNLGIRVKLMSLAMSSVGFVI